MSTAVMVTLKVEPAICGLPIALNKRFEAGREFTVNGWLEPVIFVLGSVAVITSVAIALVMFTETVEAPAVNVALVGVIEPEVSANVAGPV